MLRVGGSGFGQPAVGVSWGSSIMPRGFRFSGTYISTCTRLNEVALKERTCYGDAFAGEKRHLLHKWAIGDGVTYDGSW